jgi:hypothetical protein
LTGWDTVRELAGALPGAEEGTCYGEPAFRVRKKLFAWMSPHEDGALCVHVEPGETELLLEANPDAYFTTPHYAGHPMLLVRLEQVDREELAERIEEAWLLRAPKRVVDAFVSRKT